MYSEIIMPLKFPVKFILFLVFLMFCASPVVAGPIYVYKEADGTTRFTTKRPPSSYEAKVYTGSQGSYSHYKGRQQPRYAMSASYRRSQAVSVFKNKYDNYITAASLRYGVSKSLIKAVIHAESAFNPRAVSHKGARGLMQLMPFNLKKYGVRDAFSPEQNIFAGTRMLSELLEFYAGDLKLTLAAYNAGEGAVKKYRGIPPYKETQGYVKKVIKLRSVYG